MTALAFDVPRTMSSPDRSMFTRTLPWVVALGGATMATGAALPWMTMFAGLKSYSGLIGYWGWLLLLVGCGLASVPALQRRGVAWNRWAIVSGLVALAVVLYAGAGVLDITGDAGNALMVPRMGPGLPVALAGSTIGLLGASLAGIASRRAARRPSR